MHPVVVEGDRLALREFHPGDSEALHLIYGDARATEHLSFEPRSLDEVIALVDRIILRAREQPRTEYSLAVIERSSRDLIGTVRLALGRHCSAEIGYALRADRWGQGLGTEAVHLLCAVAFRQLGLHRIWGARAPDNLASARVMDRLGMVVEGRIRDHVHVRGRWRDSIVHSLLEGEWVAPNRRWR